MTKRQWTLQHELFERMYWTLVDLPVPVIAAVNGHAYAGGLELALSCDFIYASNAARFALTEVTLGIMPGAGGTQNLPRAIGERRAKEILMTGKPFTALQASEYGLINAILEPGEVLGKAIETAEVIAPNQEVCPLWRSNGIAYSVPFRNRGLQPPHRHRRPDGRCRGIQRKA